ncbi:Isochorismatase [Oligella ureolytica]|uniref:Acyl carrier protein n=1 Tax=Oligella ureolytica TaxID=90244 RepID=A0A378XHY8_9BURK|nr:acyl carrier protein [Oligella ureolytica]QPT39839.1 acyl carrier protein [Oligella ureolytica]SUA54768.1 Isochorismatase [Oligella ureolytica]SUA57724.1 Isochorismatase [Oligella ureolytica]
MQEELINIVAKALEIAPEEIAVEDNLMVVGLHSLALMTITEQIAQRYNRPVSFAALMQNPTIQAWEQLLNS